MHTIYNDQKKCENENAHIYKNQKKCENENAHNLQKPKYVIKKLHTAAHN